MMVHHLNRCGKHEIGPMFYWRDILLIPLNQEIFVALVVDKAHCAKSGKKI